MSIDGIPPLSLRPIEAVQPHRRVEERPDEEKPPPEQHGSEPEDEQLDEGDEDDGAPHLDIRI